MWTGNYNGSDGKCYRVMTLAGSMWTGNYNVYEAIRETLPTLAGSMWTGNYNSPCSVPSAASL